MTTELEGHTLHSYDQDLDNLHNKIREIAELVLEQTKDALFAFDEQNFDIANRVIEREHRVDSLEKTIDDEIISVTARRSPVAKDLRVIMSLCKTVTDFERIGDEAAKIAHMTKEMFDSERASPSAPLLRDVNTMGKLAVTMLQNAVVALRDINSEIADLLLGNHSELDLEFQSSLRRLTTYIMDDSSNVGHIINIVLLLKAIERIGDHSRNVAESIVFLKKGMDIRHLIDKSELINMSQKH